MIRVTCPSCQQVYDYLDFYRGMTIFCKKCKAGVLVPKDAESIPESAPAPAAAAPIEPPVAPALEVQSNHTEAPVTAPERAWEAAPPPADVNHQIQPEVAPPPAFESLPEPVAASTSAAAYEDDTPGSSNKRTLILAGILIVILAGGAALIARSLMQGNTNPLVVVDPNKDSKEKRPDQKDGPAPNLDKRPDPKPNDEPNPEKDKTKETPKATDAVLVSWYTTDFVPFIPPSTSKYFVDEDKLDEGFILLVAKVRLTPKALNVRKTDEGCAFDLDAKQFVMENEDGEKAAADGFESKGGFVERDGNGVRTIKTLAVQTAMEPEHYDASVIFLVILEDADKSRLKLQFRDFPKVKLDAATRTKPPEPPKNGEPEKKIDDKTPPKKIEDEPKKIDIVKKPDDAAKKIDIKTPNEIKKAAPATTKPQVEIVEWFVANTLPSADPDKKVMSLSSKDRLDENTFVAVKVKISGDACAAMKGEVNWKVPVAAKDFTIEGDAPKPFKARGLEKEGAFGSTTVTGYLSDQELVLPFQEAPDYIVQGVFFTIPRDVVEGDLDLFFRGFPPARLTADKRRK